MVVGTVDWYLTSPGTILVVVSSSNSSGGSSVSNSNNIIMNYKLQHSITVRTYKYYNLYSISDTYLVGGTSWRPPGAIPC